MWGAVWLVKELKSIGFVGVCSSAWALDLGWCSWRLTRGDVVVELDFEPEPVLVDYASLPAAHERDLPPSNGPRAIRRSTPVALSSDWKRGARPTT